MKYNVLIADDVELNRMLIRVILRTFNEIFLHEVENGEQALDFMENNEVDLLILDLMMPVMDGFQVLERLQSMDNLKDIPVIIYSAVDKTDTLQKALKLGAYDYFTKPLSKEEISIVVPLKVKNALKTNRQRKLLEDMNIQLQKEIDQVRYLSFHDSLTGLYNRAFLDMEIKRMEKDLGRFLPLSIIVIDLNELKVINDVLGHRAGDRLIQSSALILSEALRTTDIITRIGGDEFCILLPKVTREIAERKKIHILKLVEEYNKANPSLPLGMAIGVATSYSDRENIYTTYQIADDRMYNHKYQQSASDKGKALNFIIKELEKKDYYSMGHGDRMMELAREFSEYLKLPPKIKENLVILAKIHDMGKIGVPGRILGKTGKLTSREYEQVKEHSRIGYNIAKRTREFFHIAEFILYHHERFDGKGYPAKLEAYEIPFESRIIAVLDAYDAMTNKKTYKEVLTSQDAIRELMNNSGSQFDPDIVKDFIDMLKVKKV